MVLQSSSRSFVSFRRIGSNQLLSCVMSRRMTILVISSLIFSLRHGVFPPMSSAIFSSTRPILGRVLPLFCFLHYESTDSHISRLSLHRTANLALLSVSFLTRRQVHLSPSAIFPSFSGRLLPLFCVQHYESTDSHIRRRSFQRSSS